MFTFKLITLFVFINIFQIIAQDFITIWPDQKMPNSMGLSLEEIESRERITQVAVPGMYSFFTSREENTGSAVLVIPSGGYQKLTYILGGTQLAKWLNTIGIHAFVLKYRLPNSPDLIIRHKGPQQDAQRALRIIRANAEKWSINPQKIGVMGTSAGGHLASMLGTHIEDVCAIGDSLDQFSIHPDFMVLISPVISMGKYTHTGSYKNLLGQNPSHDLIEKYSSELQVNEKTPPAFIVHAANDKAVDPQNSILFYQALLYHNIPASLHIFPHGGHEIGLGNNPGSTALWTELCKLWLIEMDIIGGSNK